MGTYSIRPAHEADHEAVAGCVQAAYDKYIARIGRKPAPLLADYHALILRDVVYVLVNDDEEICGVLVMMPQENGMFVENIAIDPRFQGQGLGRMLMGFVEQQTRSMQLNAIHLYTHELMTENLRIYHHLGFAEEERRNEGGFHRVFLRKELM
ncbi:MAG TPA: GNAT family N-acetyltransferase [Ktedonobacteraceae bacterium]|jgi:ribosomal protein S18 acetylase RimI-like enzyme|nr:GNAT family N-acetyltransferase [Ktedonobacteraceae bacterium]